MEISLYLAFDGFSTKNLEYMEKRVGERKDLILRKLSLIYDEGWGAPGKNCGFATRKDLEHCMMIVKHTNFAFLHKKKRLHFPGFSSSQVLTEQQLIK